MSCDLGSRDTPLNPNSDDKCGSLGNINRDFGVRGDIGLFYSPQFPDAWKSQKC